MINIEIGISTASFFMRQYNEEALKTINSLDGRVCEVFLETYSEYSKDYALLLKKTQGNLIVNSIHTMNLHFEPDLFSQNDRAIGCAFEMFGNVLSAGKVLGAKNYTLHGKARIKKSAFYDNYQFIGDRLDEMCNFAAEYGISICLENVEWAYYNRPGFFREVKKYANNLYGVLDVKQARISGYPYTQYIDEMGDRIKTVHLSDIDKNGKICLPGKGTFDFYELFKRLKDVGFSGNMLIEVYKDDYSLIDEFQDSLNYLRDIKSKIFK